MRELLHELGECKGRFACHSGYRGPFPASIPIIWSYEQQDLKRVIKAGDAKVTDNLGATFHYRLIVTGQKLSTWGLQTAKLPVTPNRRPYPLVSGPSGRCTQ
jgi:hypothetical protein